MDKVVARNRKAFHDYEVLETVEAGMVLTGTEVKSLREGRASIKEAFARPRNEEFFILGMNIPEYANKGMASHEPTRTRKLLLKKRQIHQLIKACETKGHTVIPLKVYFKRGYAKVELAIVRGKSRVDKRSSLKKKESKRAMDRELVRRQKGRK